MRGGAAMRVRLARLLHPTTWQGPVGVVCVVTAVCLLASWQWALLTAGSVLIAAAAFAEVTAPALDDGEDVG